MIRPLRARHRGMLVVLAIVVPSLFGLGIASRRAVPDSAGLPAVLAAPTADGRTWTTHEAVLDADVTVVIHGLDPAPGGAAPRIVVALDGDLRRPELLAYWTASTAAADRLPSDASLLGPVDPDARNVFELSRPSAGGSVILYSLAQSEILASVPINEYRP